MLNFGILTRKKINYIKKIFMKSLSNGVYGRAYAAPFYCITMPVRFNFELIDLFVTEKINENK